MCFSCATDDSMVITHQNMLNAVALVQQVLNTLDITFRGVGESPYAEATARVQTFIEKNGMATRNQILKTLHRHVTPDDLDRILTMLISIDYVEYISMHSKQYLRIKQVKGKP